jgi:acylphosphatase
MQSSIHWLVAGRVQSVGFRWFVRRAATRLGLRGDVRNLPDGRVEIRARGDAVKLETLLEEVRRGPRGSRVDVIEELAPVEGLSFEEFEIRR